MKPQYVLNSLDAFPIEFLNIKLLHYLVFGDDIFKELDIKRSDLRQQCEREIKVKLIGLRQGYLSSMGNRRILTDSFINTISGYIPLFRGIIFLLGKEPPLRNEAVLSVLSELSGVNTDIFKFVLKEKEKRSKLTTEQLNTVFEDYYQALEQLGEITNEIQE
ncbi:MAG: hypothetical protein JRI77_08585 [Deltaproteobacteria bacterium]|nr:hypothetical protein [Deltaproteobacteria bacterium]